MTRSASWLCIITNPKRNRRRWRSLYIEHGRWTGHRARYWRSKSIGAGAGLVPVPRCGERRMPQPQCALGSGDFGFSDFGFSRTSQHLKRNRSGALCHCERRRCVPSSRVASSISLRRRAHALGAAATVAGIFFDLRPTKRNLP